METDEYLRTMSKSFRDMRTASELIDVVLVFGSCKVPCHKVVLAGTCDYFRTMFKAEMKESRAAEIEIADISSDIGLTLVDYLYSGSIEITEQNAQALLVASNMLLLTNVKKDIAKFLSRQISTDNCVSLLNLARLYELKTLRKASHKFLTKHWKELIETKEMGELQEIDLVELLKAQDSQEDGFRLLQNWVRFGSGRDARFGDLVQHVTLGECSKEFVCNTVMDEELMNHPKGIKLIQRAMQALMLADQPSHQSLVVADKSSNAWQCSDKKTWHPIEWHSYKYTYYSGCVSPEGFIVSGGHINHDVKPDCFSYVAHVKQWRTLPEMTVPRYAHSSIYHQDKLYIVGGLESQHDYSDSVERLDTKSLEWEDLSALPLGISTPLVVMVSDRLFVFGGVKQGGHCQGLFEYDFEEEDWDTRSPMPEECRRGAAVEFDGFIFVVGGREKSCMRYCPREDSWEMLQRTTFSHLNGPALVWDDVIITGGGEGTDAIEEYCPHTDAWSTWQLKMPKSGHARFILKING